MQTSRKTPSVVPSIADDPRFFNGIYRAYRLPQSYHTPNEDEKPNESGKESVAEQVKKAIADILGAKGNDPMAALDTLIRKNHRLEQRAETAERERDELKGKLPDEAAVKAKDDELAKWRAVAESPEKATEAIAAGSEAVKKAEGLELQQTVTAAAALLKVKPSALSKTYLGDGVPVIEGEGEAAKVLIKTGDTKTAWEDFVKANEVLGDALPALTATAAPPTGTPFVRQTSGPQEKASFDEAAARKGQATLYSTF